MAQALSSSTATTTPIAYRRARQLAAVLLGTVALTLGSYVTVPMIPVPITMQTFAVTMVGAFYGWRLGGITIAAWLLEGALGLPVFAGGSGGLLHFFGPTGGYLLSFPLIGALAGWLVARGWDGTRPLLAFCAMLLANTTCLALGATWLAVMIGPADAIMSGVVPFIPGAILKAALAAITLAGWYSAKQYTQRK